MFSNNLDCENSRGVIIYVDKCFNSMEIILDTTFSENVFVKIKADLVIGNIYRSPGSSQENDSALYDLIQLISEKFANFVLVGDFNFNDIDWNKFTSTQAGGSSFQFVKVLRDNFLFQHIDFPTRARGLDTPHVLDLVITNNECVKNINYLAPLGKSDHSVLQIYLTSYDNINDSIPKLNFNKGNYGKLRQFLEINWDSLLQPYIEDVEMMWNIIKNKLLEGVNRYIPSTIPFSAWKKDKWKAPLDIETRNLVKKKSILWKCYIRSKDPKDFTQYKKIRNIVRNKTRQVEKRNQNEIAKKCKSNPKHFWKYVKSKRIGKEPIGDLKCTDSSGNEVLASSDDTKAEILCNFFSSVFNHETDDSLIKLESTNCIYTSELPGFRIDDIKNRLQQLNVFKSPGPDGIHPKILAETANELAYPLKLIFDCSFNTKQLPLEWKYANITPLYKKGSRTEVINYRPVSLTSIVCKLMESIIRDNIVTHFKINTLFTNRQFGFIKGRSTTLQLLQILDTWTEYLEQGGQFDVIYTDLEKAFDKIPHKRLIHKLHSYGLHADIIKWIESFLTYRKQRVRIKDAFSEWAAVISGIPQGSILGPVLFIIYINDLVDYCNSGSEMFLFADDAKIFSYVKHKEDGKQLQQDLDKFKEWMDMWLLSLNVGKCRSVSYGRRIDILNTYTISDNIIEKVDKIKDLGVVFDSRLKFDEHIHQKINKAYQMLGIIKRNFIYLTPDSFVRDWFQRHHYEVVVVQQKQRGRN